MDYLFPVNDSKGLRRFMPWQNGILNSVLDDYPSDPAENLDMSRFGESRRHTLLWFKLNHGPKLGHFPGSAEPIGSEM